MVKFEDMYGTFAMIGIMALALFSIVFIVQKDNLASQPLVEGELFNETFGNLNETLSSLEGTSSSKYSLFSKEKPVLGFGAIVLFTIVNVVRTFGDILYIIFTLVIKLPLIVLGIDPTIISMLVSFLTISVIIAMWIVYKFGG